MLRVALIGFGWWGKHIASRLATNSSMSVACVIEPNTSLHEEILSLGMQVANEFHSALSRDDIDAVILTSPNSLHDVQVVESVTAGKHVFCEKPLSLSLAGAKESVRACEDAGLVLGIGHERRWEPAIQKLKNLLDNGALGTVMHAEMAFSHNKLNHLQAGSWRTTKSHAPAAGMTQMGIHLTDLLIWYFGKVESVSAITTSRTLNWETGDVVSVQLTFDAGMTATIQAILDTPHFIRSHVFGSGAWVEIRNDTHPDTPGGVTRMEYYRGIDDSEHAEFEWSDSVVANLESFASAVRGDKPYPFTSFELIHNIEVLEAIVQAADSKQVVKL